jgi:hypothetical protein
VRRKADDSFFIGWEIEKKTAASKQTKELTNNLNNQSTIFFVSAAGAYPFSELSPSIDYNLKLTVTAKCLGKRLLFDVNGVFNHDLFPYYEVYLQYGDKTDSLVKFESKDDGPGLRNLNTSVRVAFDDELPWTIS